VSAELNTARALLRAENFEGARRIVRKALDENPDNLRAWELRIEIEMEAGDFKQALELTRRVLADHPDNVPVRELEFHALARLRKKREAKRVFEQFRADFPFMTNRIEVMTMTLDSLSERVKKVSESLNKYSESSTDPESIRGFGIAHHRVNDLWTARRMMQEAHTHFPDDAELNAARATNYFQLARPALARKYARLALANNPADRRMAFLKKISWVMYFPPFYLLSALLVVFYALDRLVGRIPAYIAIFFCLLLLIDLYRVWYSVIIVVTGFDWNRLGTLLLFTWGILYALAISPAFYAKIFKPRKSVTLKKY